MQENVITILVIIKHINEILIITIFSYLEKFEDIKKAGGLTNNVMEPDILERSILSICLNSYIKRLFKSNWQYNMHCANNILLLEKIENEQAVIKIIQVSYNLFLHNTISNLSSDGYTKGINLIFIGNIENISPNKVCFINHNNKNLFRH